MLDFLNREDSNMAYGRPHMESLPVSWKVVSLNLPVYKGIFQTKFAVWTKSYITNRLTGVIRLDLVIREDSLMAYGRPHMEALPDSWG